MIFLKNNQQIDKMRRANAIVRDTLNLLIDNTKEGVSTLTLDKLAYDYITKQGATPSFLNYHGFPASVCISIDCEVVHGIPSKHKILQEGQIVSYDVGTLLDGWNGDAARTVGVGIISDKLQHLIDTTERSFFAGVESIIPGVSRLGDLGHAISQVAEQHGYGVVREFIGHGIGRAMHEDPDVPNYGDIGRGLRIVEGMTLAIEPMINMGKAGVEIMSDGWTVKTIDRLPSAHYENTIAVTANGIEILSL